MFSKKLLTHLIRALLCGACGGLAGAQSPAPLDDNGAALTNAAQVRSLTGKEAARHVPVHLRGIVIGEAEPGGSGFALHDGTAGLYLTSSPEAIAQLHPGDEIEVTGNSDPGWFAPSVVVKTLHQLGVKAIPEPRQVSFEDLLTGRFEAQWVEIKGIVRSCESSVGDARKNRVMLASGGEKLVIRWNVAKAPEPLVDAEVRVRGVCYYLANKNRQLISPMLAVPHDVPVRIEVPAPADLFSTPVRSVDTLMQFAQEGSYGHSIHVRGVVTRHQLGAYLNIRDGQSGLRVETNQKGALKPGDEVDVVGYPKQGNYSPILEDAIFRKRSSGTPPLPIPLTGPAEAFEHDANLVELESTFERQQVLPWGWLFDFHTDGGINFQALLRRSDALTNPPALLAGGRYKITGVCAVDRSAEGLTSGSYQPRSFQIYLRRPDDMALLQPPSWWTRQRAMRVLITAVGISLVAIAGVVWNARRRLKKQEGQRMAAEAGFRAIFAERNRMAREIHDTQAQGLGGISIQLEFIRNRLKEAPPEIAKHLEIARELVRNNLADVRNAIWDMRSQALQDGDLLSALENTMRQLTEGSAVKCRTRVKGHSRRLAPVTENELLHIGQEALSNAIKHAQATEIELEVEFEEKLIRLSVRDNGCGFNADNPPARTDGFGIIGMRERVAKLRGQLLINSQPETGTRIIATVPAPA
jgi:signal transduction histidine kinase